jgi:hypothetical protein
MTPAIELVQTTAAGAPLSTSAGMKARSVFLRAAGRQVRTLPEHPSVHSC